MSDTVRYMLLTAAATGAYVAIGYAARELWDKARRTGRRR